MEIDEETLKNIMIPIQMLTVQQKAFYKIIMALLMAIDPHSLQIVKTSLATHAEFAKIQQDNELDLQASDLALHLVSSIPDKKSCDPRELWEVIEGKKKK